MDDTNKISRRKRKMATAKRKAKVKAVQEVSIDALSKAKTCYAARGDVN
jgi:hypothetical protein